MKAKNYLILSLLLAFALRLWGIDFGLSHTLHPDETKLVEPAIIFAFNLSNLIRGNIYFFDPDFYFYPSFLMYLLTVLIFILRVIHLLLPFDFLVYKPFYYFFARLISAIFGVGLVYFTYLLTKIILNHKTALVVLFLSSINLLLVRESHYFTGDMAASFFCILSLYLLTKYKLTYENKYLFLSAVTIGSGIATKYYPFLVLIPLVYIIRFNHQLLLNKIKLIAVCFGLSGLTFILLAPFTILSFNDFYQEIQVSSERSKTGVWGYINPNPLAYFISREPSYHEPFSENGLFQGISPFIIVLSLIGAIGFYFYEKKYRYLILYTFAHYLFFSLYITKIIRWLLPIVPLLLLFSVYAVMHMYRKFKHIRLLLILLFILGVIWNISNVIVVNIAFSRADSRALAYEWLDQRLHKNSKVAYDYFNIANFVEKDYLYMEFNHPRYNINNELALNQPPPFEYMKDQFQPDYIIVNGWMRDRYKENNFRVLFPQSSNNWTEFYDKINNYYQVVWKETPNIPNNIINGPEIIIYAPR